MRLVFDVVCKVPVDEWKTFIDEINLIGNILIDITLPFHHL